MTITNITEREQELRAANADLRTEIERLERDIVAADTRIANDKVKIERLERDLVAATLRIENDALELAELKLNGPQVIRGVSLDDTSKSWMGSMRDVMNDYKQAAECEAAEVDRLSNEIAGLTREQIGLALDAARYRSMGGAL